MEFLSLRSPRTDCDPTYFGLYPDNSAGDGWLVDASEHDAVLLCLLVQQQDLHELHVAGEIGEGFCAQEAEINGQIAARTAFLRQGQT